MNSMGNHKPFSDKWINHEDPDLHTSQDSRTNGDNSAEDTS